MNRAGGGFFGGSGGSLASMASSGNAGGAGAPSCGSAGAGRSPYVCGQPGQQSPSVTNQAYIPSGEDFMFPPACKSTPG